MSNTTVAVHKSNADQFCDCMKGMRGSALAPGGLLLLWGVMKSNMSLAIWLRSWCWGCSAPAQTGRPFNLKKKSVFSLFFLFFFNPSVWGFKYERWLTTFYACITIKNVSLSVSLQAFLHGRNRLRAVPTQDYLPSSPKKKRKLGRGIYYFRLKRTILCSSNSIATTTPFRKYTVNHSTAQEPVTVRLKWRRSHKMSLLQNHGYIHSHVQYYKVTWIARQLLLHLN